MDFYLLHIHYSLGKQQFSEELQNCTLTWNAFLQSSISPHILSFSQEKTINSMKTRLMKINYANLSEGFILNFYSVRVRDWTNIPRWLLHLVETAASSQLVLVEHEILSGTESEPLCWTDHMQIKPDPQPELVLINNWNKLKSLSVGNKKFMDGKLLHFWWKGFNIKWKIISIKLYLYSKYFGFGSLKEREV